MLADGDAVTFADKFGNVVGCRMMWHPAHRNWIIALLMARCQRNLQFTRADNGVFKEQFVEISQAEEEQRPRVLRF